MALLGLALCLPGRCFGGHDKVGNPHWQCHSNQECSFQGTCFPIGKVCMCEEGRVEKDCSVSAAVLTPVRAMTVSPDPNDSLKRVSTDVRMKMFDRHRHNLRGYVLFDLNQARGELTSNTSGGVFLYIAYGGLWRDWHRGENRADIEFAMVPDVSWSGAIQNKDAPPISGTLPGGTLTYGDPGDGLCSLRAFPYYVCDPMPRIDVTSLVVEAQQGLNRIAFRLRNVRESWNPALEPSSEHVVLELRGMRKISPSPAAVGTKDTIKISPSPAAVGTKDTIPGVGSSDLGHLGTKVRSESCSAWGDYRALEDFAFPECGDKQHSLSGRSCLPGITEMRLGLDVLSGKTKAAVFAFSFNLESPKLFSTSYVLPNELQATAFDESASSATSAVFSSLEEFYQERSVRLGVSDRYRGVALKGGVGYAEAHSSLMQRKSEFLEIKRIRSYFNVALGTTELALTPDFLASVAALPSEYSESSYQHFLATFGTHYTQTATMGGVVQTAISVDRCFSAEHAREEVAV